jgi:hypothetical protein
MAHAGVFLHAPQAAYTFFLDGVKTPEASAERSVDARPTQENLPVFFLSKLETVGEDFVEYYFCEPDLVYGRVEWARKFASGGCELSLYAITGIG